MPELGRPFGGGPFFLRGAALYAPAMSKAAVVLLSGGLDSMVVAGLARAAGYRLLALTVDYNQRHRVELEAAARIAAHLGAERHLILPLDLSRFGGSALTDDIAVPKSGLGTDIPVTYVPARNTIFLSLCLGWAEAAGARDLFIGVNALDYSGYPDCRPEYIEAYQRMATLATKAGVEGRKLTIHTPLLHLGKSQIVQLAAALGLEFSLTYSCYDPGPSGEPCRQCDACLLRQKGFEEADIEDR